MFDSCWLCLVMVDSCCVSYCEWLLNSVSWLLLEIHQPFSGCLLDVCVASIELSFPMRKRQLDKVVFVQLDIGRGRTYSLWHLCSSSLLRGSSMHRWWNTVPSKRMRGSPLAQPQAPFSWQRVAQLRFAPKMCGGCGDGLDARPVMCGSTMRLAVSFG